MSQELNNAFVLDDNLWTDEVELNEDFFEWDDELISKWEEIVKNLNDMVDKYIPWVWGFWLYWKKSPDETADALVKKANKLINDRIIESDDKILALNNAINELNWNSNNIAFLR